MAHLNDSPVQAHSAGDTFPYVIGRQYANGKSTWIVLGPKVEILGCQSHEEATSIALTLKGVVTAKNTCDDCGAQVESVIGCPDGAEICQDCFDNGNH